MFPERHGRHGEPGVMASNPAGQDKTAADSTHQHVFAVKIVDSIIDISGHSYIDRSIIHPHMDPSIYTFESHIHIRTLHTSSSTHPYIHTSYKHTYIQKWRDIH